MGAEISALAGKSKIWLRLGACLSDVGLGGRMNVLDVLPTRSRLRIGGEDGDAEDSRLMESTSR